MSTLNLSYVTLRSPLHKDSNFWNQIEIFFCLGGGGFGEGGPGGGGLLSDKTVSKKQLNETTENHRRCWSTYTRPFGLSSPCAGNSGAINTNWKPSSCWSEARWHPSNLSNQAHCLNLYTATLTRAARAWTSWLVTSDKFTCSLIWRTEEGGQ